MEYENLIAFLKINNIKYCIDYSSACLSSFKTGGKAKIALFPDTLGDFCEILNILNESDIKYFIIGKGTNTFFSDNGYDGAIISTEGLNKIEISENKLLSYCGAGITDCAVQAMINGLTGFEFACGIPGSVGGAVFMNCSAFDKSISDILDSSLVYDTAKKRCCVLNREQHLFYEKHSVFEDCKTLVHLCSQFRLEYGDKDKVYSKMLEIAKKRISTQPLEKNSLGSTFKRPQGSYASRLIDTAGLKGYNVGGVYVSKKHAGFVVNDGVATSDDLLKIISDIKKIIYKKFGVLLEEEVIFVE